MHYQFVLFWSEIETFHISGRDFDQYWKTIINFGNNLNYSISYTRSSIVISESNQPFDLNRKTIYVFWKNDQSFSLIWISIYGFLEE